MEVGATRSFHRQGGCSTFLFSDFSDNLLPRFPGKLHSGVLAGGTFLGATSPKGISAGSTPVCFGGRHQFAAQYSGTLIFTTSLPGATGDSGNFLHTNWQIFPCSGFRLDSLLCQKSLCAKTPAVAGGLHSLLSKASTPKHMLAPPLDHCPKAGSS